MRRLLTALAVASVVVAFAPGCSSSSSPSSSSSSSSSSSPLLSSSPSSSQEADDPLPDAARLLKQSSAAAKDLKSVHLALSVVGRIEEMPVKTLEADLTNEPRTAAKGDAKITIMGVGVGIKFVEVGRRLYVVLPGGEGWRDYGSASTVYDVAAMVNPDTGLANMLADFVDPTVEARETVGGQDTIRVSGKVTADAVNKIFPLDASKRLSSTVWIQERGDHQLVAAELKQNKDDSIQMVFSNWNAPVTVDKPAVL
jgi:lipoprotein LprG